MDDKKAVTLFKCLGDLSRFSILKALLEEDMYVERLSERLSLTPATVSFHLKKLEEAGAVSSYKDQYYTMYRINRALFNYRILDLLSEKTENTYIQHQRDEKYRKKVIGAFFEYGRLKAIPAQRKKARIVYEEIAKAFEPDRDYTEREVNAVISGIFDDFCTVRRTMISEGLMERDHGIYRLIQDKEG